MLVLLQSSNGLHGYDIIQFTGLGPGTLYPMLARLEEQGMLASEWEASEQQGRPPRHVYNLTDTGRALAKTLCVETGEGQFHKNLDPKPV